MKSGFIKVSRSILSWRWYQSTNTKGLFLYLILNAAWKPYKDVQTQMGLQRGQCLFSFREAERETRMSSKAIRCALERLEKTGEIEKKANHLASVINIKKYGAYQDISADHYIKLPRWHSGWDWFHDLRASLLYLHIILTAAYKGTEGLERGQVFTRLSALSADTGSTESEVRTDLAKLERAGLISGSSTNRGRLITVTYYDLFTGRLAGSSDESRQADPENVTGKRAQQLTGQLYLADGLNKPFSKCGEADRGTPFDRQKGTPDVEKGHTDCEVWGTPKGTPSIIEEKEESKNGRGGKEHARAHASPLPVVPEERGQNAASVKPCITADDVAAMYGRLCPSLPPLSLPLTKRQRRLISTLIEQLDSRERVQQLFCRAEKSDFLAGRADDGIDWQADFDWLIDVDHALRILAGKYDSLWGNRTARHKGGYSPADGQPPTYDMGEYVEQSISRLLNRPSIDGVEQRKSGSG